MLRGPQQIGGLLWCGPQWQTFQPLSRPCRPLRVRKIAQVNDDSDFCTRLHTFHTLLLLFPPLPCQLQRSCTTWRPCLDSRCRCRRLRALASRAFFTRRWPFPGRISCCASRRLQRCEFGLPKKSSHYSHLSICAQLNLHVTHLTLFAPFFFRSPKIDAAGKPAEVEVENGSTLILPSSDWASVTSTSLDLSPRVRPLFFPSSAYFSLLHISQPLTPSSPPHPTSHPQRRPAQAASSRRTTPSAAATSLTSRAASCKPPRRGSARPRPPR